MNDLRRRAVAALDDALTGSAEVENTDKYPLKIEIPEKVTVDERGAKICVLETGGGIKNIDLTDFDRVYAQVWDYESLCGKVQGLCAVLPVLAPSDDMLKKALAELYDLGCRRVMCHTAGQVYLAGAVGFDCDMSYRANITNSAAYRYYKAIGCRGVTLSPELPDGAVRAIGGGAIVYGRLPLMHMSRCLGLSKEKNSLKKCAFGRRRGQDLCENCGVCRGEIVDRRGVAFPVRGMPDCVNVIYNSVVTDKTSKLNEMCGASHFAYYVMD
jgi:hypothetical protein